ncbi:MAG: hypothetical protein M3245_02160 [Actinomycetota bacterium]|nr:hypothetical protein [Actinomycetota bacterium]
MAVDEGRRQRMYRKLEKLLGVEEARTLMEYLPPSGWSDVVRKTDLEIAVTRVEAKIESKLNSQTKTLVGLMPAQVLAVAGLAFAAARLG